MKNKGVKPIPKLCHKCIIRQSRSAARFANLNDIQTRKIVEIAEKAISDSFRKSIFPQTVVRMVADGIIDELNEEAEFDNYKELKDESNRLALSYEDKFKEIINTSQDCLETGLQIAASGNIIDFGAMDHEELSLDSELKSLHEINFKKYDINSFKTILESAEKMLYICDNSGEIVFDKLFMEILKKDYPDLEIIAAVRDRPIINDAILEDARFVGLNNVVNVISSGSIYPGTILNETSDEFKEIYKNVDIILSKGQGNLETLLPIADDRIFFLLRVKCDYMADLISVDKDSLVLMQGGKSK